MINLKKSGQTPSGDNVKKKEQIDTSDIVIPEVYTSTEYMLSKKTGESFSKKIEKKNKENLTVEMIDEKLKAKYSFCSLADLLLNDDSEDVLIIIDDSEEFIRVMICNKCSLIDSKSLVKPFEFKVSKQTKEFEFVKKSNFKELHKKINILLGQYLSSQTKKIRVISDLGVDFLIKQEKVDIVYKREFVSALRKIEPIEKPNDKIIRYLKNLSIVAVFIALYMSFIPSYFSTELRLQNNQLNAAKQNIRSKQLEIDNYKAGDYATVKKMLEAGKRVCRDVN